ncbi:MAG: endonuclease/exonuclease/phosphatase family protein, partial [Alkalispirochaeta sp.]
MVLWTVTAGISCTVLEPAGDSFVVVSYNVENLFDAARDGTEYSEFTPEGGWTRQKMEDRLQRLGDALGNIRPTPDVIVLTEVENNTILDDLFRRYVVDVSYPYRVFSSHPLGATGVAVASRYPVTDVRVFQPRAESETPVRPVLEVRLQLADTAVVVFANHWKSKRGGAPSTEPLRRAAAALLASRLAVLDATEPDLPTVVCGDLNEEPREGEYIDFSYPTA